MPGRLNGPGLNNTSQTLSYSSFVLIHPDSIRNCFHSTRSQSLGRCRLYSDGKRRWSSCKDPKVHKSFQAHYSSSTNKISKSLCPNSSWHPERLVNDYRPIQSWRLLSSWGKWGIRETSLKDRCKSNEQHDYDWYNDHQRRIEENLKRFEEIKRRIDSDPFGMVFGRRLKELYPPKWRLSSESLGAKAADSASSSSVAAEKDCADKSVTKSQEASNKRAETEQCYSNMTGQDPSLSPSSFEYDIDPISMRKVLKRPLARGQTSSGTRENMDEGVNIPVKPFMTASSTTLSQDQTAPLKDKVSKASLDKIPTSPQVNTIPTSQADGNVQDWLAQEGFGSKNQAASMAIAPPETKLQTSTTEPKFSSLRIESALDRHLASRTPPTRSKLQYDPKENKTEDIDLLRASDVRASSGLRGRTPKETAEEQQGRRNRLAADYKNRVQDLERQFAEEIGALKGKQEEINGATDIPNTSKQMSQERVGALSSESTLQESNKQQAISQTYENTDNGDKPAQKIPTVQNLGAQPTVAQWAQPGEGDMASNVHEFANRDRWYKKKAPHAMEQSEPRVIQAAKDRALVREIRGIYEDTYGVIDTKHRQSANDLPEAGAVEHDSRPVLVSDKLPQSGVNSYTLDTQGLSSKSIQSELQEKNAPSNLEGMAMIQRLFEELHETQSLIQAHRLQLERISTTGESNNLLQSLTASEQRVLQTLKTAWGLLKTSTALSSRCTDENSSKDSPPKASSSTAGTAQSPGMAQQVSEHVYRIIAYDARTQQITTAKTTSLKGWPNEKPSTLSEALSNLTNPAKFVPYFASLDKLGYEILSGGTDILVFKKVRKEISSAVAVEDTPGLSATATRHTNPIDGTTTQTGNFASPTGFVNHDSVLPPSASELEGSEAPYSGQISSGEKVRREEPVFSGSARTAWQDSYDQGPKYRAKVKSRLRRAARRKRTLRRMVWVGVWTAVCCYTVGLATEHLRV